MRVLKLAQLYKHTAKHVLKVNADISKRISMRVLKLAPIIEITSTV